MKEKGLICQRTGARGVAGRPVDRLIDRSIDQNSKIYARAININVPPSAGSLTRRHRRRRCLHGSTRRGTLT